MVKQTNNATGFSGHFRISGSIKNLAAGNKVHKPPDLPARAAVNGFSLFGFRQVYFFVALSLKFRQNQIHIVDKGVNITENPGIYALQDILLNAFGGYQKCIVDESI